MQNGKTLGPVAAVRIVGATALAAACAAGLSGPLVIHLRDLPARPVYDIEWVTSYRAAAAIAMAVMERELGLPRLDVSLHFLPDREAFRRALVDDGYESAFADVTASRMDAISGYRRVLFNEPALTRLEWPQRAGFIAHELTHTLQYEIGGGRRGTSDQWLREGFADWVASGVFAALAVSPKDEFRQRRIREYRVRRDAPLPRLEQLATFPQWVALATRANATPMLAKSYLAVDFLIVRHGIRSVIDYFSRFAQSDDRLANFAVAFGEPLPGFETALGDHLARLR